MPSKPITGKQQMKRKNDLEERHPRKEPLIRESRRIRSTRSKRMRRERMKATKMESFLRMSQTRSESILKIISLVGYHYRAEIVCIFINLQLINE